MTMKSVQVHVEMLAGHIGGSIAVLALGMMLWPMMVIGVVLIMGHGLYKLYGKTLFGDDAEMLMTLPFTAGDLVRGKTVTFLLWFGILLLMSVGSGVGLILLPKGISGLADYLASDVDVQQIAGMAPWQVGVSAGWNVISPFIYITAFCLLIVTVELYFGRMFTGKRKRGMTVFAMLFSAIIYGVILSGIFWMMKWAQTLGAGGFWLRIAVDLTVLFADGMLYRLSVGLLERKYDLV